MMEISDDDVRTAGEVLDCIFDPEQVRFLKSTSSCSLHACPGSGKTTLLVAKLAILARKWGYRDRGILVLSHTNVARGEVEQRLVKEPRSSRLLGYPHFIGTIQSFVDRFIAIPYLRAHGVSEPRVDDDLFADRATSIFFARSGWQSYGTARSYLGRQRDEGRSTVATLHYSGAGLRLATEAGRLPGPDKPTTQQLSALKMRLSKEGIFRFSDMFAFAAEALNKYEFLRSGLQRRFPWIFVDEMQDTSREQDALLDSIFGGSACVFYRIGDKNQAIFSDSGDESSPTETPWASSIDLPRSHRLAPRLADLVSPLTVVHPLTLKGNDRRRDRAHTIFVFDESTISRVLPAFGDLVLREWPGVVPASFVAKAVGFRKSPPESASLPGSLKDYWPGFEPTPSEERCPRTKMIAAVRHGRRLVHQSGNFSAACRLVTDALARLVELAEGTRCTRQAFLEKCKCGALDDRAVKALIKELLRTECVSDERVWSHLSKAACSLLAPGLSGSPAAEARSYIAWDAAESSMPRNPGDRVFIHRADERQVAIEVTTIHAVKGETHDATLVLETYLRSHDVGQVLPFLAGKAAGRSTPGLIGHMKRLFVGATRPKELLCFAVHRDRMAEEQSAALATRGWSVRYL